MNTRINAVAGSLGRDGQRRGEWRWGGRSRPGTDQPGAQEVLADTARRGRQHRADRCQPHLRYGGRLVVTGTGGEPQADAGDRKSGSDSGA